MTLFAELVAWEGYLGGQLAIAEVDERSAAKALARVEAECLIKNWGGGRDDKVTIAKAQRDTDPEVVAAEDENELRHAYRKLVEVLAESVAKDSFLVSRELTRRTGRNDRENRSGRWTP